MKLASLAGFILVGLMHGCSLPATVPDGLQAWVERERDTILSVTSDPSRRIFIFLPEHISPLFGGDVDLTNVAGRSRGSIVEIWRPVAESAYRDRDIKPPTRRVWVLRMLLAHEIGHQMGARTEEVADIKGIYYFQQLGWPCKMWVDAMRSRLVTGDEGTEIHNTRRRLAARREACPDKKE